MSVALLLDENFPTPSSVLLQATGLDVEAISDSAPGVDDEAVLARAVRDGRWLVTFDLDYGDLIFARGHAPPPALLLFRVPSYRPRDPAAWVMRLIAEPDTCAGRFVVFDGVAVRTRPFLRRVGDDAS